MPLDRRAAWRGRGLVAWQWEEGKEKERGILRKGACLAVQASEVCLVTMV
jgi:hypothetical protein